MHSYFRPHHLPSYHLPLRVNSQLTAIHHDRLLRDQALLQRFARTNRQLLSCSAATAYEAEVVEKELRLSELMRRSQVEARVQQERLRESAIEEILRYQELMRRMELERMLIIDKQKAHYLTERRWNTDRFRSGIQFGNRLKQYQSALNFSNKQDDLEKVNIENIKRPGQQKRDKKKGYYSEKKKDLLNCYETFGVSQKEKPRINQVNLKKHQKVEEQNSNAKIQQINNSKNIDQSLQQNGYGSVTNKKTNRVSFNLSNNKSNIQPDRSYHESPQVLKPIKENNRKNNLKYQSLKSNLKSNKKPLNIQKNVAKLILNRLKVSQEVYRDSELRNLKYESNHLFNTFQTEVRLRSQLRERVCKQPNLIVRFGLLV